MIQQKGKIIVWMFKILLSKTLQLFFEIFLCNLFFLPLFYFLTLIDSACEIDDVLIEVIHLKPRSRMKKLMKKSSDSYDPSLSVASSNYTTEQLLAASEKQSNLTLHSPERVYTESEHIGEQIKVEFKKALANRRPSST